jgi:rubredoxin
MKVEFHCPICGGADTTSFQVGYAAGTNSQSLSGGGIGLDGSIFVGGASGISRTALALRMAPPAKQSEFNGVAAVLLGVLMSAISFIGVFAVRRSDQSIMILLVLLGTFSLLAAAMGIVLYRRAARFNTHAWPRLREKWSRQWMCLRCGHVFVPEHGRS